ncbi:MAG: hypothetical protein PVF54_08580 [Anaerolineae bacterium]
MDLPSTTEQAQSSLSWPLAAFIVDGEVGPDQILEHAFERQEMRNLATRIQVTETEQLNELYRTACRGDSRGKYASRVIIALQDGRTLETGLVEGEINRPQDSWDRESSEEKFRWLNGYVLDQKQLDAVVEAVGDFGNVVDVHTLTEMLA